MLPSLSTVNQGMLPSLSTVNQPRLPLIGQQNVLPTIGQQNVLPTIGQQLPVRQISRTPGRYNPNPLPFDAKLSNTTEIEFNPNALLNRQDQPTLLKTRRQLEYEERQKQFKENPRLTRQQEIQMATIPILTEIANQSAIIPRPVPQVGYRTQEQPSLSLREEAALQYQNSLINLSNPISDTGLYQQNVPQTFAQQSIYTQQGLQAPRRIDLTGIDINRINTSASRGNNPAYTVKELQSIASQWGLPSTGNKSQLVGTLLNAIRNQ
ncbi:hypothetical protein D3C87_1116640 [compost metagenome]